MTGPGKRTGRPGRRRAVGLEGERIASAFLEKRGYEILERNYRCRRGEVDLIARDGRVVVFVEVKARTSDRYGEPELAVDLRKQRKISIAALHYLSSKGLMDVDARFDVVVIKWEGKAPMPALIQNAFDRFE
ncbi:YraN family protein [Thermodesulfobacteriota bacterium]